MTTSVLKLRATLLCGLLGGGACVATEHPPDLRENTQALAAQALPGYGSVAWEEVGGATLAQLREQLPLLEANHLTLVLHWRTDNLDDPERWALVEDAAERGIAVHPWLLLPDAAGYFPNATNYAQWIDAARTLLSLWREHDLPDTALTVDMEPPKDKLHEFTELTAAGDPLGVVRFLEAQIDREQLAAASEAYRAFVSDAHELGFKVDLTTLLPLLDDYADGDDFMRQSFRVPLDAAEWDEVSFQIHRTIYAASYPVTSYLVYDYGRIAKRRFGERAGIGIGLTHAGISPDASIVYANGDALRVDTEAALAAGYPRERIGVYSLLGIYERAPVEQWLQPAQAKTPLPDLGTGVLHTAVQLIDALGR